MSQNPNQPGAGEPDQDNTQEAYKAFRKRFEHLNAPPAPPPKDGPEFSEELPVNPQDPPKNIREFIKHAKRTYPPRSLEGDLAPPPSLPFGIPAPVSTLEALTPDLVQQTLGHIISYHPSLLLLREKIGSVAFEISAGRLSLASGTDYFERLYRNTYLQTWNKVYVIFSTPVLSLSLFDRYP
jgi:hypothetical protein